VRRREETTIAKKALIDAGFNANNVRVKHGTGTAIGWLNIYADIHHILGCSCQSLTRWGDKDQKCRDYWEKAWQDMEMAVAEATGRSKNPDDNHIAIHLGFFDKEG
jgi:hypothetical protein